MYIQYIKKQPELMLGCNHMILGVTNTFDIDFTFNVKSDDCVNNHGVFY